MSEFVITATGVISALGSSIEQMGASIDEKKTAIRFVTNEDGNSKERYRTAFISDFVPENFLGKKGLRTFDRTTLLLLSAVEVLFKESNIDTLDENLALKMGIIIGTNGSLESILNFELEAINAPHTVEAGLFPNTLHCTPASYVSIRKGIKGGCITLTNGETASLDAIGAGVHYLRSGRFSRMVCGGVEEYSNTSILCYNKVAEAINASRPVLGEGAAVFLVEKQEDALRSGRKPIAEILAFSSVYNSNVEEGYLDNIKKIKSQCLQNDWESIQHLYSSQNQSVNEIASFSGQAPTVHYIGQLFGNVGPAIGSFQLIHALASRSVESGNVILLNNICHRGTVSSLLIRKK